MKKFTYILFIFYSLISCNSNTILKKPKNLLSKEKMVDVLVESYIAKNAKTVKNINHKRNINYLSFLYTNQGIDSVTFNESLKYYTSDLSTNEEILKLVEKSIDQKLNDLKSARDTIYNFKIDSLEIAQKKLLEKQIIDTKEILEKKLTSSIDSIKKLEFPNLKHEISTLEKSLKDTLKLSSSIISFKDSIFNDIKEVKKIATDSIDEKIESYKLSHQKSVDKKINNLKEKNEKYILKITKNLKKKKYK